MSLKIEVSELKRPLLERLQYIYIRFIHIHNGMIGFRWASITLGSPPLLMLSWGAGESCRVVVVVVMVVEKMVCLRS